MLKTVEIPTSSDPADVIKIMHDYAHTACVMPGPLSLPFQRRRALDRVQSRAVAAEERSDQPKRGLDPVPADDARLRAVAWLGGRWPRERAR